MKKIKHLEIKKNIVQHTIYLCACHKEKVGDFSENLI